VTGVDQALPVRMFEVVVRTRVGRTAPAHVPRRRLRRMTGRRSGSTDGLPRAPGSSRRRRAGGSPRQPGPRP